MEEKEIADDGLIWKVYAYQNSYNHDNKDYKKLVFESNKRENCLEALYYFKMLQKLFKQNSETLNFALTETVFETKKEKNER